MNAATPFNELPNATQAALLCTQDQFQMFAGIKTLGERIALNTSACAQFVRNECDVTTRAQLDPEHDPVAAAKWQELRTEFDEWRGRIPARR